MSALLTFTGVACRRGERLLWRGVDLTLDAGAVLHVTGANGVGKSSLIRMAASLLPPYTGTIDRAVPAGLLDEAHALDPERPLARALAFWATVDGVADEAVGSAMAEAGIRHLADVPVRMFSTGQRKRAALARLLLAHPRLWLLDEPANGLDKAGVDMLAARITEHRATGGAVLLASHFALPLDDVATLDLGAFAP